MVRIKNAAGQLLSECREILRDVFQSRPRSGSTRASRELLREMGNLGFVVLPDFLSGEQCADLIRRIDDGLARYSSFVQIAEDGADHRLYGLDAVDEQIRRVAFHPFALDLLTRYQRSTSYEAFAL